jgi:hypothetical protein
MVSRFRSFSRTRRPRGGSRLLRLERLEDRAVPATFTVGNTSDGGLGSLRQAILDSNASSDSSNVIQFAIPGNNVHTINLLTALPAITRPVLIDGYTQSGSRANTREVGDDAVLTIELNGAAAGASASGLTITAADTTVRGLVINRFGKAGIVVSGAAATQNVLAGNYIGTDVTGTTAVPNGMGLSVSSTDVTIGGTASGAGNLISGNLGAGVLIPVSRVTLQGNWIGTDGSGMAALGNQTGVLLDGSTGSTVGGTAGEAGNVISGNREAGIEIRSTSSANLIQGNLIGTDVTGTVAVPNRNGLSITAANNTIGGTAAGAGNLISGNQQAGISISGALASGNQVQGNRIGTDITGTLRLGNGSAGVFANGQAAGIAINNALNTVVGGTDPGARNFISGNLNAGVFIGASTTQPLHTLVEGNYIGTDITGTLSVRNGDIGVNVQSASGNTVGGTTPVARNIISGNGGSGVVFGTVPSGPVASNNVVEGNYIGTDVSGTHALGNGSPILGLRSGVEIDGAIDNLVGGTAPGSGNLISGNTRDGILIQSLFGNLIEGNTIGTDATGSLPLGNLSNGIEILNGSGNVIGGTDPGAGNLVSGNVSSGIQITGSGGNLVQGNRIGTNASGTASLGNGVGMGIYQASDNTIGGTSAAARNLISGNHLIGMDLYYKASGNHILGNYIGTDITGTRAVANGVGLDLSLADDNFIGGTNPGAGNLISGNAGNGGYGVNLDGCSGNLVAGNLIGTDVSGSVALGNDGAGIEISESASRNTVGGTSALARNVISGNRLDGILFWFYFGQQNRVQGNYIGTDSTGTVALANGRDGVRIFGAYHDNLIGGTDAGAGNLISGNGEDGVFLGLGATNNQVQGNWIGTNVFGTASLGNGGNGVEIQGAAGNLIGGLANQAGNVISGNQGNGVLIRPDIYGDAVTNNLVQGNLIGTDVTGTVDLGNGGNGVTVASANRNTIGGTAPGAGNVIAFNGGDGVLIDTGTGNPIQHNRIFANAGLGIELLNHGNNDQPAPVLTSASSVDGILTFEGTFTGQASTTYTLEFFANSDPDSPDQGERFLTSITITTDANGNATFTVSLEADVGAGEFLTATATDPNGNTSAFSDSLVVS